MQANIDIDALVDNQIRLLGKKEVVRVAREILSNAATAKTRSYAKMVLESALASTVTEETQGYGRSGR